MTPAGDLRRRADLEERKRIAPLSWLTVTLLGSTGWRLLSGLQIAVSPFHTESFRNNWTVGKVLRGVILIITLVVRAIMSETTA